MQGKNEQFGISEQLKDGEVDMKEYIVRETEEITTFGSLWKRYEPAAELIRCESCRYFIADGHYCKAHGFGRKVRTDDFCPDAERKGK